MDEQLAILDEQRAALAVRQQVNQIQYLLSNVLMENEHYTVIPGTSKPTLLQSGAEKIAYMFKLVPHYDSVKEPIDGFPGHREYTCTCSLYKDGVKVGEAIASCSTMESRYRWRDGYEDTGEPIPADAKDHKQEYRKKGFGMKKVNGNWLWVRFIERQENPDIADTWNTVLQMAQKRAFVRAIRSTTAASDIFTQDIEDLPMEYVQSEYEVPQQTAQKAAPKAKPKAQSKPKPSDAEKARMRELTGSLEAAGYDGKSSAKEIWNQYQAGGMDAVEAYVSSVLDIEFEDVDVDF